MFDKIKEILFLYYLVGEYSREYQLLSKNQF